LNILDAFANVIQCSFFLNPLKRKSLRLKQKLLKQTCREEKIKVSKIEQFLVDERKRGDICTTTATSRKQRVYSKANQIKHTQSKPYGALIDSINNRLIQLLTFQL